ncbi:hypothetical protein NOR53_1641 [gamma proteobacterium NOR5-3]|nr:hypothetical protein NOR53_1641 [gamma proteobacterium NOR5-3]
MEKEKRSVEGVKRRLIATLASKQSGDSVETRENAIVPFSGNNLVMPVKPRLDRFVRENIPSVLFTQEELAATRRRYEEAIAALAAQLELMGRDLNKDQELKQWKTQLVAVTAAQKSIRETSVEAFIAYRKFELSPDSLTTSEQFKKLVKEAQNSAAEAQSNFISLMEGT